MGSHGKSRARLIGTLALVLVAVSLLASHLVVQESRTREAPGKSGANSAPLPSPSERASATSARERHDSKAPAAPDPATATATSQASTVGPEVSADQIEVIPPGDKAWSKIAEYDREAFADTPGQDMHKRRILKHLDTKPGMVVADVGAGGGRIAWPLSEALGPNGVVLAIDINPLAIEIMSARLNKDPPPHQNLQIVHSHPWNVGLSRTPHHGRVDRACLIEAHFYKHFPDHKETLSCLRSIFLAMRPGALLLVHEHKNVALKAVVKPLERVGFVQEGRFDQEDKKLDPSFILTFRRP